MELRQYALPFLIIFANFLPRTTQAQDSLKVSPAAESHAFGFLHDVAFVSGTGSTPAHLTSLEYSNKNKTPIALRVNIAHRFASSGLQIEGDAYPVINKKTYAYLNTGIAVDALFPNYRGGLSVFRALPKGFEAEGGFRFLYFKSPVWIYTASMSKYYKKYLFTLSTFLTPDNGYLLQSYFLKSRYYFNDRAFMMLTLGTGISPDDRRNNNQLAQVTKLRSHRADINFKLFVKKTNAISFGAGLMKQQDLQKISRSQFTTALGYQKMF